MKTTKDITGHRFGKWTALRFSKVTCNGVHLWWCKCDCGTEKEVNKYQLGKTSCQCFRCATAYTDLSGMRFDKLTAIKYCPDKGSGLWQCQCDCGSIIFKQSSVLRKANKNRCRKCTWEDLTGMRFGNQVVLNRDYKEYAWLVRCDCGEELIKKSTAIKTSSTCGRCESKRFLNTRFGKLVIKEIEYKKGVCVAYALCDCGNWWVGAVHSLNSERNHSCGCAIRETHMEEATKMIGKKIGDLTLIKIMGYLNGTYKILFQARCKCGKKKFVSRQYLESASSCGCHIKKNRPRGEDSALSVLRNIDAQAIREFKKSDIGYTGRQLAEMFNVDETVISRILSGRSYKE